MLCFVLINSVLLNLLCVRMLLYLFLIYSYDFRLSHRSLGHSDGRAQCCGRLSRGYTYSTSGSLSNINCTGSESSFASCRYTTSRYRCSRRIGLASAICYDQPKTTVDTGNGMDVQTNSNSNSGYFYSTACR